MSKMNIGRGLGRTELPSVHNHFKTHPKRLELGVFNNLVDSGTAAPHISGVTVNICYHHPCSIVWPPIVGS